jgi:hypothetical protein
MNELLHSKDEWQHQRPSLTANKNISDIFERRHYADVVVRHAEQPFNLKVQPERIIMSQFVTAFCAGVVAAVIVNHAALIPTPAEAAPMSDADKAAMKQATATCRAQVKEQARFEEISLYARHKLVKKCINETLKP